MDLPIFIVALCFMPFDAYHRSLSFCSLPEVVQSVLFSQVSAGKCSFGVIAHHLKPTGARHHIFILSPWWFVIAHCLKPTGACLCFHCINPVGAFITLHLRLVMDYCCSLPYALGGLSSLIQSAFFTGKCR